MPFAKCIKPFSSPRHGNKECGKPVEDTHDYLIHLRDAGLVDYTPEKKEPELDNGTVTLSSSLPAGQVLPNDNSTTSNAEKTAPAKTESEPSQSTPATSSGKQTSSTDATTAGGQGTKKKRAKRTKNAGR